jgi:hypothetical protein
MKGSALEIASCPSYLFVSDGLDLQMPLLIKDHLQHVNALKRWTFSESEVLFGASVKANVINYKGENVKTIPKVSKNHFKLEESSRKSRN